MKQHFSLTGSSTVLSGNSCGLTHAYTLNNIFLEGVLLFIKSIRSLQELTLIVKNFGGFTMNTFNKIHCHFHEINIEKVLSGGQSFRQVEWSVWRDNRCCQWAIIEG